MKRSDEREFMGLLADIANSADDLLGLVNCYGLDIDDEVFNDKFSTLDECYADYCKFVMDVVFKDVDNH